MSNRFTASSSRSTISSVRHLLNPLAGSRWICSLAAAGGLAACLVGLAGSATAADSDGDGLAEGREIHVLATDPLDPDTDENKTFDDLTISTGSDPNGPNEVPASVSLLPMLYKASLSLHVRGDRTTVIRYSVYYFYYNYIARPQGAPLSGSGTGSVSVGTPGIPLGFSLPAGGLQFKTASLSGTLPPVATYSGYASVRLRTHPNTSFVNDSGFFYPGGGPGAHSFG